MQVLLVVQSRQAARHMNYGLVENVKEEGTERIERLSCLCHSKWGAPVNLN